MNTPTNTYWKTKSGERILINNMEDIHVKNCIGVLTRQLGCSNIYTSSDKQRLCDLISMKQLEATLSALSDPNY